MKENRRHELSKIRVSEIRMGDICNSAVIGIIALWAVWVSTTLLINFMKG